MSVPSSKLLPRSGDAVIDALTNGTYWQLDGNRTIQWAVANGFEGERWNDPAVTAQYLKFALSGVSYYADVSFQYLGIHANPDVAFKAGSDITLSLSENREAFPSTSIWAQAWFPYTPWETHYVGQAGDMFLNVRSQANFLPSYDPGSAGYSLLLHELGHALGLKHTHDDGGTGRPTLADVGLQQFDQDFAAVMSYRDELGFDLVRYDPATFMIFDVLALQALYGKNTTTNAGNTRFELSALNLYGTIWDASGNDTVDASAATSGWTVVLPSLRPSPLVPEAIGYALPTSDLSRSAPTTLIWMEGDIENASGSRFSDTLIGNGMRNLLRGGQGNDIIDGGAGTDTAVFAVARGGASITRQGTTLTVQSAEGLDALSNVERLLFSDQLLVLDAAGTTLINVSTMPAAALSQFVLKTNPTAAELDVRSAAASAAYEYYADVLNVANPLLGPYESLGVSFSATSTFQSRFGSGSSLTFIAEAYDEVFLRSPSAGQQQAFEGQLSYFSGIYQRAGVAPGVAELQARGAVLGQMIGYVMTDQNEAGRSGQTIDDKVQLFLGTFPSVSMVGLSANIEML
jgi:hypothetical protein